MNRHRTLLGAVTAACAIVLIAGCTSVTQGQAVSTLYDPFRAGGLPAQDGPSGVKDDAPQPTGEVQGSDGSDVDKLALPSVNDIADFWQQNWGDLNGSFSPIENLLSYDSDDPSSPVVCNTDTYGEPNAFYCPSKQIMAWDRGVLVADRPEVLRRRLSRGADGPRVRPRRAAHGRTGRR